MRKRRQVVIAILPTRDSTGDIFVYEIISGRYNSLVDVEIRGKTYRFNVEGNSHDYLINAYEFDQTYVSMAHLLRVLWAVFNGVDIDESDDGLPAYGGHDAEFAGTDSK